MTSEARPYIPKSLLPFTATQGSVPYFTRKQALRARTPFQFPTTRGYSQNNELEKPTYLDDFGCVDYWRGRQHVV